MAYLWSQITIILLRITQKTLGKLESWSKSKFQSVCLYISIILPSSTLNTSGKAHIMVILENQNFFRPFWIFSSIKIRLRWQNYMGNIPSKFHKHSYNSLCCSRSYFEIMIWVKSIDINPRVNLGQWKINILVLKESLWNLCIICLLIRMAQSNTFFVAGIP